MKKNKKYGVLLVNVGAPNHLSTTSIRHYLKLFLSDRRVIELHPLIWQIILRLFVLLFRPRKSLTKYALIWQKNESSPLLKNSRELAQSLQNALDPEQENIVIKIAMNYSQPFVKDAIERLQQENISHLILLPLFPQYSATTVAASLDKVWHTLLGLRHQPEVSSINSFYNHPMYIQALCQHIRNYWDKHNRSQLLLLSYHGIPSKYVAKGDPYFQHCIETTQLVQQQLNLTDEEIMTSFQSRFGKLEWLQPSTQDLFDELPAQGIKSIDVISPSFIVDCLETLEELNITGRKQFHLAGGKTFHYIPCLNNDKLLIATLSDIIQSKLT